MIDHAMLRALSDNDLYDLHHDVEAELADDERSDGNEALAWAISEEMLLRLLAQQEADGPPKQHADEMEQE